MADTSPWYMDYPLANLKTDPKVRESFKELSQKYQAAKKPTELTDEELKDYESGISEWESQRGFREATDKMNVARKHYITLRQRGINLDSPRTGKEAAFAKAIQDELTEAQGTADMYGENKELWDKYTEAIRKQDETPEHEQVMDIKQSRENLYTILGKGDVRSRNRALNEYSFITKAKPVDKQKTWTESFKNIGWGEDQRKTVIEDKDTGKIITSSETGMSDKRAKEVNEQVFDNLPAHEKKQYKTEYDAEENKGGKTFKEWVIDKYSPIMSKKKLDQVRYEGGRGGGVGPAIDEQGEVVWTNPVTDMKDPFYGDKAQSFQSTGSLNLNNLFPKSTSYINLPITSNTVNTSTGETEEGFVGENLPSIPISIDFYPIATEDIKLLKTPTIFGQASFRIAKGEKITAEKKAIIDKANMKAGKIIHRYNNEPYLLKRTQFKQVEISDEYGDKDIKSFGRSNIVPYFDVKDRLITLPGFKQYDEAVTKRYNELNGAGINAILGGSGTEILF